MSGGWNTIESDAGVFTFLIESLGVKNIQFEELVSLDSEVLREINSVGVIFLFKYPTSEQKRKDKPLDGEFDYGALEAQDTDQQPVWFAAQTIQNACGTQALLSVLLNQSDDADDGDPSTAQGIDLGPTLTEFKDFTSAFPADLRGEALSNSEVIRDVHNSFARASPFVSDETRLAGDDDDVYHFIAYTSINETLYELDGLQPAPIRHGDVGACPKVLFADAVVPVLQRRIARYPAAEIRFNLLAVCPDLRLQARARSDAVALATEEYKRREWRWENALRRHNFVGFVGELMKDVTAAKLKDQSYDKWIEDAKAETKQRLTDARKRKGAGLGEADL